MPSHVVVPEVLDLLEVGAAEIIGNRRSVADARRGSGYDVQLGVGAIIYHRQALRDRDAFRAIYFDTAAGDDADAYIEKRFKISRILRSAGTGSALLSRATADAGAGTIWSGTRISVTTPGASEFRIYEVSASVSVGASQKIVPVSIRALDEGPSRKIDTTRAAALLRVEDPLWDSTWQVDSIVCADGLERENDDEYKARAKEFRQAQRRGYADSITRKCREAGADQAMLFPSNWLGDNVDFGLNHCFVGDQTFETTAALLRDCRIAVDDVRVLGADLLVFGMTKQAVTPTIVVHLWLKTSARDNARIVQMTKAAVVGYFAKSANAFYFTLDGIRGAILRALRTDVQSVEISGLSEPVLATLFDTVPLKRYTAAPSDIAVSISGPAV